MRSDSLQLTILYRLGGYIMSHKRILFITATILLLSPSAFAEPVSNPSASALGNKPFDSRVFEISNADALQSEGDPSNPDWRNQSTDDFHLKNQDIGVKFTQGMYYGNKGPASRERGIQVLFSTQ